MSCAAHEACCAPYIAQVAQQVPASLAALASTEPGCSWICRGAPRWCPGRPLGCCEWLRRGPGQYPSLYGAIMLRFIRSLAQRKPPQLLQQELGASALPALPPPPPPAGGCSSRWGLRPRLCRHVQAGDPHHPPAARPGERGGPEPAGRRRAGAHDSPRHRAPSEPRHAGCGAAGAQRAP